MCVICSAEFVARKDSRQQACTIACGVALRRRNGVRNTKRVDKICIICQKPFSVPKCFEGQKTCGIACGGILRRKGAVTRICDYCFKEFTVKNPSNTKAYCSKECGYASTRGTGHHRWNPDKIVVCKNCSQEFRPHEPKNNRKFCSVECNKIWKRLHGNGGAPIGTKAQFDDYIVIKVDRETWVPEHRLIAETLLGRTLEPSEIVHHVNGIKVDNRPENLLVTTRTDHMKIHAEAERIGLSFMGMEKWIPSVDGMAC